MNYSSSPFPVPPLPPAVPAKRKRPHSSATTVSSYSSAAVAQQQTSCINQERANATFTNSESRDSHRHNVASTLPVTTASEVIHCICGDSSDDGFTIACDDCGRWSHMICFDILPGQDPDEWRCWECVPREVDRRKAARRQEERRQALKQGALQQLSVPAITPIASAGPSRKRRERRVSINTGAGGPASTSGSAHVATPSIYAPNGGETREDELVDIDDDWRNVYVHLSEDAVPNASTRTKLQRAAQNWRGISALIDDAKKTKVVPVPQPKNDVSAAVRPPSYSVQTTVPIAGETLITPYTSTIVPSAVYLSDPLNAYAHIGMPKPHVHLVPPPLSVALDARMAGNEARFIRSGCRPNAVLRPVLCPGKKIEKPGRPPTNGVDSERSANRIMEIIHEGSEANDSADENGDIDTSPGVIKFAIFALRDLKASEEIVLGWEWDDGAVVHQLPALIEEGSRAGPSKMTSHHMARIRLQMQTILQSLRSSFVSCACGNAARDCALRLMDAISDSEYPLPASRSLNNHTTSLSSTDHARSRGRYSQNRDADAVSVDAVDSVASAPRFPSIPPSPPRSISHRHPAPLQDSNKRSGLKAKLKAKVVPETMSSSNAHQQNLDLGPLIGAQRGIRTRVVGGEDSGGLLGVEQTVGDQWDRNGVLDSTDVADMEVDEDGSPSARLSNSTHHKYDNKGKGRDLTFDHATSDRARPNSAVNANGVLAHSRSTSPVRIRKVMEAKMPPKMRKCWMHDASSRLRKQKFQVGRLETPQVGEQQDGVNTDMDVDVRPSMPALNSSSLPSTPVPVVNSSGELLTDEHTFKMDVDSNTPHIPASASPSTSASNPIAEYLPEVATNNSTTVADETRNASSQPRRSSTLFSLLNEHPVSPLNTSKDLASLLRIMTTVPAENLQSLVPEFSPSSPSLRSVALDRADNDEAVRLESPTLPTHSIMQEIQEVTGLPEQDKPFVVGVEETASTMLLELKNTSNTPNADSPQPAFEELNAPPASRTDSETGLVGLGISLDQIEHPEVPARSSFPVVSSDSPDPLPNLQCDSMDAVLLDVSGPSLIEQSLTKLEPEIGNTTEACTELANVSDLNVEPRIIPQPELSEQSLVELEMFSEPVAKHNPEPPNEQATDEVDVDMSVAHVPSLMPPSEQDTEDYVDETEQRFVSVQAQTPEQAIVNTQIDELAPSPEEQQVNNSINVHLTSVLLQSSVSVQEQEDTTVGIELETETLEDRQAALAHISTDRETSLDLLGSRPSSTSPEPVETKSCAPIIPTQIPQLALDRIEDDVIQDVKDELDVEGSVSKGYDTAENSTLEPRTSVENKTPDPVPSLIQPPPEPTKVRRTMADYKERKKKRREEEAAKAALSPMTDAMSSLQDPSSPTVPPQTQGDGVTRGERDRFGATELNVEEAVASIAPVNGTHWQTSPNSLANAGSEGDETSLALLSPVEVPEREELTVLRPVVPPVTEPSGKTESRGDLEMEDCNILQGPRVDVSSILSNPAQSPQRRELTPQAEDGEITNAHSRSDTPLIVRGSHDIASSLPNDSRGHVPGRPNCAPYGPSSYVPSRGPSTGALPTGPRSHRNTLRVPSTSPTRQGQAGTPPPVRSSAASTINATLATSSAVTSSSNANATAQPGQPVPAQPKLSGWAQRERVVSAGVSLGPSNAFGGSSSAGRPSLPSGPRALREREFNRSQSSNMSLGPGPGPGPGPGAGRGPPPRGPHADREHRWPPKGSRPDPRSRPRGRR